MEDNSISPKKSTRSNKTTAVQIRLLKSTIDMVDDLKEYLHTTNRTNVLVRGVRLMHFLMKEQESGNQVIIKKKNGEESVLQFM